MSPIAGQTAGPNGLNFFVDTHGWPREFLGKKIEKNVLHYFFTVNAGPFSEYEIKHFAHIYLYNLAIAGQTAEQN